MLQTQVNYWNYVETKRHNYATEEANLLQAKAALSQAESAARNADTNAYNALINRYNAETNRINAAANVKNAETNAFNANTQWTSMLSQKTLNDFKQQEVIESTNLLRKQGEYYNAQTGKVGAEAEKTKAETKSETIKQAYLGASERAKIRETQTKSFSNLSTGIKNLIDASHGLGKVIEFLGF